jgi:hypothetical protein
MVLILTLTLTLKYDRMRVEVGTRLMRCLPRESRQQQQQQSAPKKAQPAKSSLPATTNWVTPQSKKQPDAWNVKTANKKKPAAGGGSVFAAMMDSDSD